MYMRTLNHRRVPQGSVAVANQPALCTHTEEPGRAGSRGCRSAASCWTEQCHRLLSLLSLLRRAARSLFACRTPSRSLHLHAFPLSATCTSRLCIALSDMQQRRCHGHCKRQDPVPRCGQVARAHTLHAHICSLSSSSHSSHTHPRHTRKGPQPTSPTTQMTSTATTTTATVIYLYCFISRRAVRISTIHRRENERWARVDRRKEKRKRAERKVRGRGETQVERAGCGQC